MRATVVTAEIDVKTITGWGVLRRAPWHLAAIFPKMEDADAKATTECLLCLSCESRAEVDALVAKAVAAGGTAPRVPQDHGFMYGHGFEDLDGHTFELVHMDPNAAGAP